MKHAVAAAALCLVAASPAVAQRGPQSGGPAASILAGVNLSLGNITTSAGTTQTAAAWLTSLTGVVIPDSTNYNSGKYTAYLAPFGLSGATYTESMTVNPALFPGTANTVWSLPTWSGGIRNFLAIDYGDYDGTVPTIPVTPSQINNIVTLQETHSITLGGDTANFDVIDDQFLTSTAGNNANNIYEVEILLHTPSFVQSSFLVLLVPIGSFTSATTGITWNFAEGVGAIPDLVFYPSGYTDELIGTVDIGEMLKYLVGIGFLTGSEWWNGFGQGDEVKQNAGSALTNYFYVNYVTGAPPSTRLITTAGPVTEQGSESTIILAKTGAQQWSPTQKNSAIVLGNLGLSAASTLAATNTEAFANNGVSSGLYYYEVVPTPYSATDGAATGLGNTSSSTANGAYLGSTSDTVQWAYGGGVVNGGNFSYGTWATWTTGNVLCWAIDLTHHMMWGRVNNGNWNNSGTANPATNAGGLAIPAGVYASPLVPGLQFAQSGDTFAAHFSSGSWTYTAPSGFGSMDAAGAATTLTLMTSPPTGQTLTVIDGLGNAGTYNTTVVPASGLIGGASNKVISTNYGSFVFTYTGTGWNVK